MRLAALENVDKFYADQDVLVDAQLELTTGDRIALIGRNGAGKSTLLRLLLGEEKPDGGTIYRRNGLSIACLLQDPYFAEGTTINDAADEAFQELDALEQELKTLEAQGLDKPDIYEAWEKLHATFELRGGYARRSRRDAVLYALGFRGRETEEAAHLSGGEKTRLGLAKLLMAQPDALLLDEPTNHLDIEMREWLESYLSRYAGGIIIVSHDRDFLDKACNHTAHINLGILRTFAGTPSQYRHHREEQERIEAATRLNQQKEFARIEAAAAQMKKWAGQNAKLHRRAKAMEKRRDRYQAQMLAGPEAEQGTTRFVFECEESAELILQAQHLSKSFDKQLFKDVQLTIRKGERIALIGPNGAGKSTFLKVLLGELASDDARAQLHYGSRVRVGYYDQELRGVNPELTLIDEMTRMMGERDAHNMLGRFLFPYEAQFKRIADLSGGERARLALLKLTMGQYNFLVLDEPTNHLDVEMIEALESALALYEGTLLIISHDRRFISQMASQIWELREGVLEPYPGDWNYYLYKKKEALESKNASATVAPVVKSKSEANAKTPSKWQLQQDAERLENEIAELETALEKLNQTFNDADYVAGLEHQQLTELGEQHARCEERLLQKMAQWEKVLELLEAKA